MRPATLDSYRERLDRVLVYIRDNLDEPLTIDRLAGIACLSPFHFHRIFSAFVGETVNGHVRRLRLEQAALRIASTADSVTDTALAVGYETPTAFARAFRERFGLSPSEFREHRGETFFSGAEQFVIKEVVAVKPEMREIEDMRVLFVRRSGAYSEAAKSAWETLMGFAYKNRLLSVETRGIGIGYDDPAVTAEECLRYDACITFFGEVALTGDVGIQNIAGGRYAVFLHKGPYDGLAEIYRDIFGNWIATSGCTLRDQPSFEIYLNRDPRRTKPENLRTEIWVPVE